MWISVVKSVGEERKITKKKQKREEKKKNKQRRREEKKKRKKRELIVRKEVSASRLGGGDSRRERQQVRDRFVQAAGAVQRVPALQIFAEAPHVHHAVLDVLRHEELRMHRTDLARWVVVRID